MYEAITGTLKEKDPLKAIVETAGISYRLLISLRTYTKLPHCGTTIHLYLSQVIREDAHTLYGFESKEDRNLFEMLLTVSGIGPKTALAIVGHMEINVFQRAIQTSDTSLLSKLPGIGKKTAERLIIDMRDKLKGSSKRDQLPSLSLSDSEPCVETDAINALINLGYHLIQSQKAIAAVRKDHPKDLDLGNLITLALQKI